MKQQGVKSMIFEEIFPADDGAGSQISSLRHAEGVKSNSCKMQWGVKSYCYIMQRVAKSYLCKM
jgi:hypothetical protein